MRSRLIVPVFTSLVAAACSDATSVTVPEADLQFVATSPVVAFVGATVIPMHTERVLPDHIVVVDRGRITLVGPAAAVQLPAGATQIDARGRYLIPGLADMHAHVHDAQRGQFVPAGITTVRNLWGVPGMLEFAAATHDPLSTTDPAADVWPSVYSASPGIDGSPPTWDYTREVNDPAAAAAVVDGLAAEGWSFLKLYNRLSLEVYDAIAAAADARGIRFGGHVPWAVPLEHALSRGHAFIEHLTGYDRALGAELLPPSSWAYVDAGLMREVAERTAEAGTWNCPTLVVTNAIANRWLPAEEYQRSVAARRGMVRALRDAGAGLLAGTDAGTEYIQAGFAIHEELAEFVSAGLTPFEALRAATSDAAKFLEREGEFGMIVQGSRADLVLLDGNPLDDIANTRTIAGVMVRGRWHTR